jgi:hypothetical protein
MQTQKSDYPIEGVHFNVAPKKEENKNHSEISETEIQKEQEPKPKKTKK